MLNRLENSDGCYGSERTQVMLRDYLEWEEINNNTLSLDDLPKFLAERQIKDVNIVQYNMTNGTVDQAFMNFVIVCRGDLDWNRRAKKIDKMRKIVDNYPQHQISLFDYDSTIYDLIIAVKVSSANVIL
ncbi:unnamed protein product [Strongylus vulgaris]|uniref:Uncharacterized protein n=1 Tax=Strongylus vulgaris TaxID=40348 RepID=A0A3P7J6X3_STRVU|nr:unnamed protein product [Strongylus vulgaris]